MQMATKDPSTQQYGEEADEDGYYEDEEDDYEQKGAKYSFSNYKE